MSLSIFNNKRRDSSGQTRDVATFLNGPHKRNSVPKEDSEFKRIEEGLKSASRSYAAQIQLLWNLMNSKPTEGKGTRDSNRKALEEALHEVRNLTLEALSQVTDFVDSFTVYLASNDSSSTKGEEIGSFVDRARRQREAADQTIDNFMDALRASAPKKLSNLWPMDNSQTESLLRDKTNIDDMLGASSFPCGLLRTVFIMVPERRRQIHNIVEGNNEVIVPKVPLEAWAPGPGTPLKLFLNVWRMLLADIETINLAVPASAQVDAALGVKVRRLIRLYRCLPDALEEFNGVLSELDFKKVSLSPSQKRRGLSFRSLWLILLRVLGIRNED